MVLLTSWYLWRCVNRMVVAARDADVRKIMCS
jgi:hypothetical protein